MGPYNKKLVVYNSEMFKVQKDLEGYYCLATVLEKGKQPIWWEFKDGEAVNAGFCKDSLIELRDLINEALDDEAEVEVNIEVEY